ncbi:hypothetical protein [Arcobacter sp. FWKO B]|uniref:hypothetical protein n=1 Tax=Arcobacter sp. FWKO B TaxID=2593672 RepID=UPI0018A545A9|nr:hypothetical protein [Arcobacter sp. FWKO B]QOG13114.1 hypothetical protein FWKOB_10635 [Arcobacter sp. FWKO B]
MLRVNGILPSVDECIDKNKSAFIKGYDGAVKHLHNLVDSYPSSKIRLFNREIDNDTIEVLQVIINCGIAKGTPYSNIEIFCCRDIDKRLDLKSLEQNPILKNIKIYRHHQKDIFHDRFLSIFVEEEQFEDIYLMGNSLSSIKNKPMSIAQILGKCIINLYEHTQSGLKKELKEIVDKSKRIYPKVEL